MQGNLYYYELGKQVFNIFVNISRILNKNVSRTYLLCWWIFIHLSMIWTHLFCLWIVTHLSVSWTHVLSWWLFIHLSVIWTHLLCWWIVTPSLRTDQLLTFFPFLIYYWKNLCLNSSSHHITSLNAWSTVGETIWKELGVALEVGRLWGFKCSYHSQSLFLSISISISACNTEIRRKLPSTAPVPGLLAWCHAPSDDHGLSLWNSRQAPTKCFSDKLLWLCCLLTALESN